MLFSPVPGWSSVLLVQHWALAKGPYLFLIFPETICISTSIWARCLYTHCLHGCRYDAKCETVSLAWGNYVLHNDTILGDMTGYCWVLRQALSFYLFFCLFISIGLLPPWVALLSCQILEEGCYVRFLFLHDGRWDWDFRARHDGPMTKVSCIWMLSWWTGFSFLSYPN